MRGTCQGQHRLQGVGRGGIPAPALLGLSLHEMMEVSELCDCAGAVVPQLLLQAGVNGSAVGSWPQSLHSWAEKKVGCLH